MKTNAKVCRITQASARNRSTVQTLIDLNSPILRFAQLLARSEEWSVDAAYNVIHAGYFVTSHDSEAAAWAYVFEILDCLV